MKLLFKSTNNNQNSARFIYESKIDGPATDEELLASNGDYYAKKENNDNFLVENYDMLRPKNKENYVNSQEIQEALKITGGDISAAIAGASFLKKIKNRK